METDKLFNKYYLCEEEFSTFFGDNIRAIDLNNLEETKEHLNLFILNSKFSKDKKQNEVLKISFEDEVDKITFIHDSRFCNLNGVEKIDEHWVFIKEYTPGLRLSNKIYKENSPQMNLNAVLYIFSEICIALSSIQDFFSDFGNTCHGMIHPFNVVFNNEGQIKLDNCFFGKVLSKLDINKDDFLEYYGNFLPVNERNLIQFNHQSDLIQLGILFLELLIGKKIRRDISLSKIEEIIEVSKTVNGYEEKVPLEEEMKLLIKKTLQIAPAGNFSNTRELIQSLKSHIMDTGKHTPTKNVFLEFLASHFKLDFISLANILRAEKIRDYSDKMQEFSVDLKSTLGKLKNLYSQENLDNVFSTKEDVPEIPQDDEETSGSKETDERDITKRTDEASASKKIVIVDDDLVTLKILEKAISQHGIQVFTSQDGAEAYDLTRSLKPDLLISDMLIPKIHGIDLCKKIKTDESLKEIPVILMSAIYTDSTFMADIVNSDADHFIEKPLNINKVVGIIKSYFNEKEK